MFGMKKTEKILFLSMSFAAIIARSGGARNDSMITNGDVDGWTRAGMRKTGIPIQIPAKF